jgi:hypothetical protein
MIPAEISILPARRKSPSSSSHDPTMPVWIGFLFGEL